MAEVATFAEIEKPFVERVNSLVFCVMATQDTHNRLRSRMIHVYWEGGVGWTASNPGSLKARHIAQNPHVSLTYAQDPFKPIYVACKAAWDNDPVTKARVWDLFTNAPPPLGYDLAQFFGSVDNPNYGVLRFTPWRIELGDMQGQPQVWRA